jgi:hypothetical protein
MTTLRWLGHRLEAFGQTVERGQTGDFTPEEAEALMAQPNLRNRLERVKPEKKTHTAKTVNDAPPGGEPEADTGEGQPIAPETEETV